MSEKLSALLVYHASEAFSALKVHLQQQGVRVIHSESCAEAQRRLGSLNPAPLVFTETQLPDGTWADILALAEHATLPVNVIVVSGVMNTRLYVEAIGSGAFDFLAPPFNPTDLAYVVRCASGNALARRAARGRGVLAAEVGRFAQIR